MSNSRPCGAKEGKEPCPRFTSDVTGLCTTHRQEFEKYFSSLMLRCKQCPVKDFCAYEEQAPAGVCYFEIYDRSNRWDVVSELETSMKRVLRAEYFLFIRLQRTLAHRPGATSDVKLIKEFHVLGDKLFAHFESYAKFKGWYIPKKKEIREETKTLKYIAKVLEISDKEEEKKIITVDVPGMETPPLPIPDPKSKEDYQRDKDEGREARDEDH